METNLKLSVHQLVDFLLRTGDIDNRVFNRSSMAEGSRLHSEYQSKQGTNYISEYYLERTFPMDNFSITLQGRADGIIKRKNGDYVIDEIKTTVTNLEDFRNENIDWHLGQAKCYALMFALENNLQDIGIKLTYIKQGLNRKRHVEEYHFLTLDLEEYVYDLLQEYINFYNIILRKQLIRNESIRHLKFPFNSYREGQRKLAKYSYSIAKNGGRFFCEAPTGIGKTISTLFPFVKALELDPLSKVFYLTAKASGKESAMNALQVMKNNNLTLSNISITAKDKICFCKGNQCNPDECPYAKGYYNKIKSVLAVCLSNYSTYDYNKIVEIAEEYQICPFELELDLSLYCDVVVCDYNYLFDPISYMKRYFDEDSSHFLVLVDEAHNLVDRSRGMYSTSLSYQKYKNAKKSLKKCRINSLKRAQTKINKLFKELTETYGEGEHLVNDFSLETYQVLRSFLTTCQEINKESPKEMTNELLEFYLELNRFLKVAEFINDRFITYFHVSKNIFELKITCLDASSFIRRNLEKVKGSVLFSATLQPMEYYIDTLGGNKESDPRMLLPSPFPRENLNILVAPNVSIKYKNRNLTYEEVAKYVNTFIKNKKGNYFIYSPSYEYMTSLINYIDFKDIDFFVQSKDMEDQEKVEFLKNFKENPERTTLGFLVMGGSFSEGIDLVSDRLIGAVIIGIGMPKINFESNQIVKYYKENGLPGHDYAYLYPGMNKVMQAVGRVIRSENDTGSVLLIDERYMLNQYQDLFRAEWRDYKVVLNVDEINETLKK